MAHPQNSPRGLFAKNRIDVGSQQITADSTALKLNGGLKVSGISTAVLTADSTGNFSMAAGLKVSGQSLTLTANATSLISSGGLKINSAYQITADSTAAVGPAAALPGNYSTGNITFGSNSTGAFLAIRGTGTGWKFANVTSVQPT